LRNDNKIHKTSFFLHVYVRRLFLRALYLFVHFGFASLWLHTHAFLSQRKIKYVTTMPAKQKKGRGKTVNLTEFNEDFIPETALDWAEDDWITDEQKGEAKLSEKIAKQRQEYSRVANNALGEQESFRTAATSHPQKKFTMEDLQPPYVAHFGNLRNGTTEEDFLALFSRDAIVTHRLINQDGKSFAFVEFNSAQALTVALSLDETFQRGRRMYVDLATAKQVERLLNRGTNERAGLSRDAAGQQQPGGLAAMGLSRDVFGGPQPDDHPGMASMGSRSNFGSRVDLHNLGELSRDMLGSAVQQASPTSASPLGLGSPANFGSWRNDGPEQQPEFPALRENNRSEESLDRRNMGAANLRRNNSSFGSPAAPPAAAAAVVPEPKANPFSGDMGNWRDAPRAEAPKMEELPKEMEEKEGKDPAKETAAPASTGSPSNSGRGGRGAGGRSGRGGMGGRGGAPAGERNASPKSTGPVNTDKWAELRR
jgi:RNA recognition motif-containing protein